MAYLDLTQSHAATDVARTTAELVAREQRAAHAASNLARARQHWLTTDRAGWGVPPQPPFTVAAASPSLTRGEKINGAVLIRTTDVFPERIIAPLAPAWSNPGVYSALADTVRFITQYVPTGGRSLNIARPTASQATQDFAPRRFASEASAGTPINLGSLAGKKGKAMAAAAAQEDKRMAEWLAAVGRPFPFEDPSLGSSKSYEERDRLTAEYARLKNYISTLVEEAKLYEIIIEGDPRSYSLDKLRAFTAGVLSFREALIAEAQSHGLGPNPALQEPARWVKLADAVNKAREAKSAAARGEAPPADEPSKPGVYRAPGGVPGTTRITFQPAPEPGFVVRYWPFFAGGAGLLAVLLLTVRRRGA